MRRHGLESLYQKISFHAAHTAAVDFALRRTTQTLTQCSITRYPSIDEASGVECLRPHPPKAPTGEFTMNTATEAASKIETFAADAKKSMSAQMEKMSKSFEDASAFNQESFDAMTKTSNMSVKAAEEINAEFVAFSKKTVEDTVSATKEMAASKTIVELMEKQAVYAKSTLDGMMKQATKMNEMAMAAAKESMEPINARFTAAADKMKTFNA
jgi:phasin family protein